MTRTSANFKWLVDTIRQVSIEGRAAKQESTLLALATALASRFGGITGFAVTLLITLYGLYGVGYLDNMLKIEENPILQGFLLFSPQYRFADLTQRLYFKSGALPTAAFWTMIVYFTGILAVYAGLSRLCYRTKISA